MWKADVHHDAERTCGLFQSGIVKKAIQRMREAAEVARSCLCLSFCWDRISRVRIALGQTAEPMTPEAIAGSKSGFDSLRHGRPFARPHSAATTSCLCLQRTSSKTASAHLRDSVCHHPALADNLL